MKKKLKGHPGPRLEHVLTWRINQANSWREPSTEQVYIFFQLRLLQYKCDFIKGTFWACMCIFKWSKLYRIDRASILVGIMLMLIYCAVCIWLCFCVFARLWGTASVFLTAAPESYIDGWGALYFTDVCDQCWCKERERDWRRGRDGWVVLPLQISFFLFLLFQSVCINPLLSPRVSHSVDSVGICMCFILTGVIALTNMTQCLQAQHMLNRATFSRLLDYRLSAESVCLCVSVRGCVLHISFRYRSLKRTQTSCLSKCPGWPLM